MEFRSSNKINAGFNMSSMTDLVFLLLIFFIILSTLVSPYALPVDLPASANRTKQKPTVSITIKPEGDIFVGANQTDIKNLENTIKNEFNVQGVEDKGVVLHVDKSVPTGTTVEVLDIAKKNKWQIVLATKP
jgi:biopolymer transport protein ExbD